MKKIVLYGMGKRGKGIYDYLCHIKKEKFIYALSDKNFNSMGNYKGKEILSPDKVAQEDVVFCLSALNPKIREEMKMYIGEKNILSLAICQSI